MLSDERSFVTRSKYLLHHVRLIGLSDPCRSDSYQITAVSQLSSGDTLAVS